ncbi:MAG: tRNA (N(6)-L-threonylcarbamoyladenosine(37)-C(2))-methylthiotransferase MtaB [Dehalococcoidales bacterium]|nr:tRNA (N(6)-L-threonylcarbamoyladenosine(37)-C(2))-methylthiotransferase MtaB [Dehalococcoidales bacterium]
MNEEGRGAHIAVDSLGCKLNQAEAESLARQIVAAGYTLVSPSEPADIYILNTCSVTHIADRKSRHWLRMAHRRNPAAQIIVTGCYAERSADELAGIEGVSLVVGNERKADLLKLLETGGYLRKRGGSNIIGSIAALNRTRAMLKVQEGCTNFCAYCIVPLVRRGESSVPADEVVAAVKRLTSEDYKEIVLTGTEIGSYCDKGTTLAGLLRRILAETEVPRLRLSSLQPPEISGELIGLWQDCRLCPHFHLSLQSGSDSALRRMKRRYSTADYERAVALIRAAVPQAAITTDVIVGFPGETAAEFDESYRFCEEIGFARIHVFPFSPRAGTAAALMTEAVNESIKRQRNEKMLALAELSAAAFRQKFTGQTLAVLWEKRSAGGVWSGFTDNYLKVYLKSSDDLANKLVRVKLT